MRMFGNHPGHFGLDKAQRDAIPEEDFAGPKRSFPIDTQEHLEAAARLIGKADDPDAVKKKAISIAKRKGFTLPEAWQEKKKAEMAATFGAFQISEFGEADGDYPKHPS